MQKGSTLRKMQITKHTDTALKLNNEVHKSYYEGKIIQFISSTVGFGFCCFSTRHLSVSFM